MIGRAEILATSTNACRRTRIAPRYSLAWSMVRLVLLVLLLEFWTWSHTGILATVVAQTPSTKSSPGKTSPPKSSPSIDEDLLNDLLPSPGKPSQPNQPKDVKPSDDSKPADGRSPERTPPVKKTPDKSASPINPTTVEDQGEDIGDSLAGRVRALLTPIREAADRLEKGDSSATTRQRQQVVVTQLDELLARRPQPKPAASGSEGATGNRPGTKQESGKKDDGKQQGDTESPGNGEGTRPAEVTPTDATRELWGQLPTHLREQLQGALPERFLPGYEALIEAYYRRISERRQP